MRAMVSNIPIDPKKHDDANGYDDVCDPFEHRRSDAGCRCVFFVEQVTAPCD